MHGLVERFRVEDRLPADATCVIVLADPLDRTLGNSFDTMYVRGQDRTGRWYLLRADYPADAFGHQRQVLAGTQGHSTNGFCRECPAESISEGTWQEMIDYCAAAGEDVTPRAAPDIKAPLCRIPRWNQLTQDGQWVFPADQTRNA